MISTFENCVNLLNFENEGFDFTKVVSMHKLFYKTNLSNLKKFELNVGNLKDISYIFASTKISTINMDNNIPKNFIDICFIILKIYQIIKYQN